MKKYNSSKTNFETYLLKKQYSTTSIASYQRFVQQFLEWTENENIEVEQMRYQDVLAYMKHCSMKRGYSQRSVQHTIITLGHYFDYLIEIGTIDYNPTKGVKVHGVKRKTLHRILEPQELDSIYKDFQAVSISQKRNKVIVGLLVYQGLKTEELDRLEVRDVKLNEGKIDIKGSRKSSGRTLQLEPQQMMEMNTYITQLRPQLLDKVGLKTDKLLVNVESGDKLRLHHLMQMLRKQNPKITKADQIRASVIVKWLKNYNLRQVQYLAGHRFISSTEEYLQSETEGLSREIDQFHPLG